ncbi:MAG: hypothetical protein AB1432_02615 [Bacteroidota bacterium]
MEEFNKNKFSELTKKYMPLAGIILLTLLLMIFFRFDKRNINGLIEEGKNNLAALYAKNLKPLFVSTEITNEDVFNFAIYQSLPIDKESNKLLLVSNEGKDNRVFEFKPAAYNPFTNNYERFVDYLELTSEQRLKVDSILGTYKKEIYLSVLKSDKNAIAINPQLSNLQKAALADLIAFSEKINKDKTLQLLTLGDNIFNVEQLRSYAATAKEILDNEYIFITPDTVFRTEFKIDTRGIEKLSNIDLNKHIVANNIKDNFKIEFKLDNHKKVKEKKRINPEAEIYHHVDSSIVKIVIPLPKISSEHYSQINDSIKINLEKAADRLKMLSIKWETVTNDYQKRSDTNIPGYSKRGEPIQFHFNFDPGAFAKYAENIAKGNYKDLEKFGIILDSAALQFGKNFSDSLIKKIKNPDREMRKKRVVNAAPKETLK